MSQGDDAERRFVRARELIGRSRQGLVEAHRLLRGLAGEVTDARARGLLHRQIWECERFAGRRSQFFSEAGQDAWLDERIFKGKRGGTFVEVGGYDGITGSNCLFFELMRGWNGIVIEPSPSYHAKCAAFRRSTCLRLAVGAQAGTAEFLDVQKGYTQMSGLVSTYDPRLRAQVEEDPRHQGEIIEVKVQPLAQILKGNHLSDIDFISLDVEGAELDVLGAFPFDDFRVAVWTVENNTHNPEIPKLMRAKGYKRVEMIAADEVYLYDPK